MLWFCFHAVYTGMFADLWFWIWLPEHCLVLTSWLKLGVGQSAWSPWWCMWNCKQHAVHWATMRAASTSRNLTVWVSSFLLMYCDHSQCVLCGSGFVLTSNFQYITLLPVKISKYHKQNKQLVRDCMLCVCPCVCCIKCVYSRQGREQNGC